MSNPYAALDIDSDDESLQKVEKKQPKKNKTKKTQAAPPKKSSDQAATKKSDGKYVGGLDKRGKREYDRRSGQKSRDTERKGGAGGHNWGKAGDQGSFDNSGFNNSGGFNNKSSGGGGFDNSGGGGGGGGFDGGATGGGYDKSYNDGGYGGDYNNEGGEETEEPEIIEKTMEEYEAEKAEKRKGAAFRELQAVKVEKINTGKEYAKKDGATMEEEDAFMATKSSKQRRNRDRKKNKAIVETGFTVKDQFADSDGGRGGGRGRGRGRGRGGRGGGRGRGRGGRAGGGDVYRSGQQVDPTSSLDFPALGT